MSLIRQSRCIEATAGSGKTTLMVNELKTLIIDHRVSPESCLAITFTDKAANEMGTRLRSVLHTSGVEMPHKVVQRMNIETIHSFCNRLLKRHALLINQSPHYQILNTIELKRRLTSHATRLWSQAVHNPPAWLIECLATWSLDQWTDMLMTAYFNRDTITYWLDELYFNPELIDDLDPQFTDYYQDKCKAFKVAVEIFLHEIETDKRHDNWLDYDDILFKTHQLLANVDWLRHECQDQLQHIFVDEFQDTSPIQWKIIHLLCHDTSPFESKKLWVVGDRCQAIYGFRGADDALMEMVINTTHPDLEHVKNTNNYRSNPAIIHFINNLFKRLFSDQGAQFLEMVPKKEPENQYGVQCVLSDSQDEELTGITAYIQQMSHHYQLNDIAILVRKNIDIKVIKAHLDAHNIPVQVSKGAGLCELDSVQMVICFLKGWLNPDDDLSWYAIAHDILGIDEAIIREGMVEGEPLFKALLRQNDHIKSWYSKIKAGHKRLVLQHIIWTLPMLASHLDQQAVSRFLTEFNQQWDIVQGNTVSLLEWLEVCINQPKIMGIESESNNNAVQIMTLHAAKGLEFPVVIIPFIQAQFNMSATDPLILSRENGLGITIPHLDSNPVRKEIYQCQKNQTVLEELRLFYVTLTRAKAFIYLSGQRLKRKNMSRLSLLIPYLNENSNQCSFEFEGDYAPRFHNHSFVDLINEDDGLCTELQLNPTSAVEPIKPMSVSSILDMLECPKLMILQQYSPIDIEASFAQKEGEILHAMLAHALTIRQVSSLPSDPDWLKAIIQSDWYQRIVSYGRLAVEKPFEYRFHDRLIRGRYDAVWFNDDQQQFEIFEFKRSLGLESPRYHHQVRIYADILLEQFPGWSFNDQNSKLIDLRTAKAISLIPSDIDWKASLQYDDQSTYNPNPFQCHYCKYNDVIKNCSQSSIMLK